jgi:hypothetical protein
LNVVALFPVHRSRMHTKYCRALSGMHGSMPFFALRTTPRAESTLWLSPPCPSQLASSCP